MTNEGRDEYDLKKAVDSKMLDILKLIFFLEWSLEGNRIDDISYKK